MIVRSVFVLSCVPVLIGSLQAHDYWLLPKSFFPRPKKEVSVQLFVGDHFKAEIERPFQAKVTPRFELVSRNSVQDLRTIAKAQAKPLLRIPAPAAGSHYLVMKRDAHLIKIEAAKFNQYLKHEGLDQIIKERKRLGEFDKAGREKYSRYLKCLLNVGQKSDATWKKTVGLKLEILLLDNPATAKKGQDLRVQILFDGKPLRNVAFFAFQKTGEQLREQALRTDNDGRGAVRINSPGIYLIRLVHMRRCKDDKNVEWESFWGALTIAVR